MTVELAPVVQDDAPAIIRIYSEHELRLPDAPLWPIDKAYWIKAVAEDRLVAFLIVSEYADRGFLVNELWSEKTALGRLGLLHLSKWIERLAQASANERKRPVLLGGCVPENRKEHLAALGKRGYNPTDEWNLPNAVVMVKEFQP